MVVELQLVQVNLYTTKDFKSSGMGVYMKNDF